MCGSAHRPDRAGVLKRSPVPAESVSMAIRSDDESGPPGRQRVRGFLESVVTRAGTGVGRLRDAAMEISGSPVVAHALAARERGNVEAAFWLLGEAFGANPEADGVAVHYWNVALDLGRVDIASPAGVQLVERHAAAGDRELAAQYWLELASAAPDVFVSPGAIATILPALKQRLAESDAEHVPELRGRLRRAMRQAVDPRNSDLHPGVALRLFEQGRELNPEAARRAAEVALKSPNLHQAKRTRLEEALAPQPVQRFKLFVGVPVELGPDAIVLRDENGIDVPIPYQGIQAVAAAEVSGLGPEPVAVIDLIRRMRGASRAEPPLIARIRGDSLDVAALLGEPGLSASDLSAFLGEILERTRAVPLPDPESALGVRLACFASLAEYESEVLSLLPG